MTAQNWTSDLFAPRYYRNILKRSWSYAFIYSIILFLAMPVAMFININNISQIAISFTDKSERLAQEISRGYMLLWIFFVAAFAIFGGIMLMNFLFDRKKAYLYHSFPVKRKTHYVCHILASATTFLIAFLINVALTLVIFALKGFFNAVVVRTFLCAIGIVLIYYILALSLTTFASVLVGQSSAAFVILLAIGFLPVAFYASLVGLITFEHNYINVDYYLSERIASILSAPIRAGFLSYSEIEYSAFEGIITLATALGIYIGGYYIYKHRKIESAGTPVVSKSLGETLKYMIMTCGAFFLGWVFYSLGENYAWLIFGFFFGALLVFIFFNLFLYRNTRKMFYGVKWLGLFMAVFLLTFGVSRFNTGANIPKQDNISSVEIILDGKKYIFEDEELVELIAEYSEKTIEKAIFEGRMGSSVEITFKRRGFIAAARRLPSYSDVERSKLMFALLNSPEYIEQHEENVKKGLEREAQNVNVIFEGFDYRLYQNKDIIVDKDEILNAYLMDLRNPNRYKGQYLATVYYRDLYLDIYSTDLFCLNVKTIKNEMGVGDFRLIDFLNEIDSKLNNIIKKVVVISTDEAEKAEYTGEQAIEIVRSCTSMDEFREYGNFHPCYTEEYRVEVFFEESDFVYTGEKNEPEKVIRSYINYFIRDMIPQFVLDDFS